MAKSTALVLVLVLASAEMSRDFEGPAEAVRKPASTTQRPFSDASPWNKKIPRRPRLARKSKRIVRHLTGGRRANAVANLYRFAVPIYRATRSTRRDRVRCTRPWGRCRLERSRVPIPKGARPAPGSDAAMVVVDRRRGKSYEFWRARKRRGRWRTAWGSIAQLNGSGNEHRSLLPTASGISRLAGVVRTGEIRRGRIPHALVFSTSNACRNRYRYPAHSTDGSSSRSSCIALGTRVQLNPRVNVGAIPNITRGERAVARALQRYGAYAVDSGGARMAFIFENPIGEENPYPAAGFRYDYYEMPHIPWRRLRVLRRWTGR